MQTLVGVILFSAAAAQLAPPPTPPAPQRSTAPPTSTPTARAPTQRPYERPLPPVHPGCRVAFPSGWLWVQGTPTTQYQTGTIYFIEFFSTTCSHCAEAAPIVHDLWSAFSPKGVSFIAVTKEEAATVKPWLDQRPEGERMEHSVVSDPTLSAERVLQYGTFTNATPRAFIVKDGIVQWWGHPKKAEPVLKDLVAGTWNPASIRDEFILESQVEQAKDLITASVRKAETTKDYGPPLTLIDQIVQQIPEKAASFLVQKFTILIGIANQPDAGYALGRSIAQRFPTDAGNIRSLARTTLNNPWVQRRDLDFAMEMATKANELQPDDARSPEVLAMAWFAKGDREQAVASMQKAISMQKDAVMLKQFQSTLERYQTATPGPAPYAPPPLSGQPVQPRAAP